MAIDLALADIRVAKNTLTGDEARAAIGLARKVREVVLGSVGSGSPLA